MGKARGDDIKETLRRDRNSWHEIETTMLRAGQTDSNESVVQTPFVASINHCKLCWKTVSEHIGAKYVGADVEADEGSEECGVFVTYTERDSGDLRGCIGTFAPGPVVEQLKRYSVIAATQDPRFPAVEPSELRNLSVKVSLLANFQDVPQTEEDGEALDAIERELLQKNKKLNLARNAGFARRLQAANTFLTRWKLGTNGIRLAYKGLSATFLPEVAEEQGWTHTETVVNLLRKAGFKDDIDMDVLRKVRIRTYETTTCAMDYPE